MNASTSAPAPGSTRSANLLAATVLVLALTAIVGLLIFLGSRASTRMDVTSTRQHLLSPQTRAILSRLDRSLTLVVATDLRQTSPAARQRLIDVLDKFSNASERLSVRMIDTGSSAGIAQFDATLVQLANDDKAAIARSSDAIASATGMAEEFSRALDDLAGLLMAVGEASGSPGDRARQVWENQAAITRVDAEDLRKASRDSRAVMQQNAPGLPIPLLDVAARPLRTAFDRSAGNLSALAGAAEAVLGAPAATEAVKTRLRPISQALPAQRNRAARVVSALDQAVRLPILTVAHAIEKTRAILLIDSSPASDDGRPRLTAIDADALLPSDPAAAAIDLRSRSEELIATAIGAMSNPYRPVVVLVHPLGQRLSPDFNELAEIRNRLAMRGIDLLEWAVALDRDMPTIPTIGGSSVRRPVVFVSLSRDVRTPEDATRMGRLADAISQIIASGKPLLLSVNPSTLPGSGAPDPMVAFLPAMGLTADSGRTLMEETRTANARVVAPEQLITDPGSAHPIAACLNGLRTALLWPIALTLKDDPPSGAAATPLISIAARPGIWAESEWQPYRQVPASQRGMVTNPPAKDSPQDRAGDGKPWLVAAAIERTQPDFAGTQRIVVVGSNGWFLDQVLRLYVTVDGKPVAATPGNAELFLSSIAWLAGQDELLVRSASAQAAPTIGNLSPGQLSALRWLLIAGLPAGTLVLGLLYRAWRG